MPTHPFAQAVVAHDHDAVKATLAPNVVFRSPVAFRPYDGREMVAAIIRGADRAFEELEYVQEIVDPEARSAALIFEAHIGDVDVNGCDFLTFDDDGLISEFTVMVRPLSAAQAVAEAMSMQFEQVKRELTGG